MEEECLIQRQRSRHPFEGFRFVSTVSHPDIDWSKPLSPSLRGFQVCFYTLEEYFSSSDSKRSPSLRGFQVCFYSLLCKCRIFKKLRPHFRQGRPILPRRGNMSLILHRRMFLNLLFLRSE